MGSFRGNCEILEVEDEQSRARWPQASQQVRGQDGEQKPPIWKKGSNNYLEDDINRLFEAVNLRTSKSLDLSDSRRNASKKPMRATGSHSPVIGFSEPVSLKQALRGMCISQAAEMAAVKRLSLPASPRISEAGKITNMYRSVVVETGCSLVGGGEQRIEISLVPEESTSSSSRTVSRLVQDSLVKSPTQSSSPSPTSGAKPVINIKHSSKDSGQPPAECSDVGLSLVEGNIATSSTNMPSSHLQEPKHNEIGPALEVDKQLLGTGPEEEDCSSVSALSHNNARDNFSKQDKKNSGFNKVASVPSKDSATSLKVVDNAAPKLRRKSRLQTVSSSSEECRKNHAASIGKYAVDGCCEFMPAGEEGSSAALRCAACSCHRNFHKKVVRQIEGFCHYCFSKPSTPK